MLTIPFINSRYLCSTQGDDTQALTRRSMKVEVLITHTKQLIKGPKSTRDYVCGTRTQVLTQTITSNDGANKSLTEH